MAPAFWLYPWWIITKISYELSAAISIANNKALLILSLFKVKYL